MLVSELDALQANLNRGRAELPVYCSTPSRHTPPRFYEARRLALGEGTGFDSLHIPGLR